MATKKTIKVELKKLFLEIPEEENGSRATPVIVAEGENGKEYRLRPRSLNGTLSMSIEEISTNNLS